MPNPEPKSELSGAELIWLLLAVVVMLVAGGFVASENPVWFTENPEQREIRRQNEWEVRYFVRRGHRPLN